MKVQNEDITQLKSKDINVIANKKSTKALKQRWVHTREKDGNKD